MRYNIFFSQKLPDFCLLFYIWNINCLLRINIVSRLISSRIYIMNVYIYHMYECHESGMSCPSCKIVWSYLLVNACSSFGLLNDHYKINQLIVCTLQLSFVKVRREILECQIMKILLCIFKQINRLKKNKIEIPYLYNKKRVVVCALW